MVAVFLIQQKRAESNEGGGEVQRSGREFQPRGPKSNEVVASSPSVREVQRRVANSNERGEAPNEVVANSNQGVGSPTKQAEVQRSGRKSNGKCSRDSQRKGRRIPTKGSRSPTKRREVQPRGHEFQREQRKSNQAVAKSNQRVMKSNEAGDSNQPCRQFL